MSILRSRTYNNAVQVVYIFLILCYLVNELFEGGIPQVNWFREMILMAAPMATLASGVLMMKVQAERTVRAKDSLTRMKMVIFFLVVIICLIVGLGYGTASPEYATLFQHLNILPRNVAMIIVGMVLTVLTMRVLVPRSPIYAAMIIIMIFGFFSNSVLGEITIPLFTDIGLWFQNNPAAAGYQVMWTGSYLAIAAIIARVFAFQERLRGGGE